MGVVHTTLREENFIKKGVEKKGRCSKESFVVGGKVLVQNVVSKLWDREAVITGVRTAADTTIVSYNLDIGGLRSTRHRKFLRKIVNFPNEDEAAEEPVMNADKRVVKAGQDRSLFAALPGSSLG